MSPRGRRASVPEAGHVRPEYVTPDGLVVHHYNRAGLVKDYDFSVLPVAEPMQRSLAALFAAGCVPHRWSTHNTSRAHWYCLTYFADFLASLDRPPADLDGLTVAMMKRWRQAGARSSVRFVAALLLADARLRSGPVADEIARRTRKPAGTVQSYGEAEFEQIRLAATRMFRAALSRIEDNAAHLERWRAGGFVQGERDWVLGEALDMLARIGDVPRHDKSRGPSVVGRYRIALGGASPEHTWQRLFLTRHEAVALGVLLLARYGWNLSVIDRVEVPRALPDQGVDGNPTYRIALDKPRRGPGRRRETRNVTDDGADSPGRLITQALAATRFARATHAATRGRLSWRTPACLGHPGCGGVVRARPFRRSHRIRRRSRRCTSECGCREH